MRKIFAEELYKQMQTNQDIWLIVGDLGYGLFDKIRDDFSDRFINVGAAETSLIGLACGLALEGKIPFCYSITPFLLYRPFETIKLYIDGEKLNVKLIGSGRNKDYHIDGPSHDASDVYKLFDVLDPILPNIHPYFPVDEGDIPWIVDKMCKSGQPEFLSLKR